MLKHKEVKWWMLPTVLFLLTRLAYGVFMARVAHLQTVDTSKFYGEPRGVIDYFTVVGNWDSSYYFRIAQRGYPDSLNYRPDGSLDLNDWAFYPLWGKLLGLLHDLSGLPLPLIATIASTLFGLAAVLMLYRWIQLKASPWLATVFLVGLVFYPTSVVLQTGYAESFFLFLLASTLLLVDGKRYLWALLPLTAMAFTRPILLPMALALGLYWLHRRIKEKRATGAYSWRGEWQLLGLAAYSVVGFGLWPLYMGWKFHNWLLYLDIQHAWRSAGTDVILKYAVTGWTEAPWAILIFLGLAIGLLLHSFKAKQAKWPPLLVAWACAYCLYIYGTIQTGFYFSDGHMDPHGPLHLLNSTWRYLMLTLIPLAPVAWLVGEDDPRWKKLLALGLLALCGLVGVYFYTTTALLDRDGFFGFP